jgi:hypothetical protein
MARNSSSDAGFRLCPQKRAIRGAEQPVFTVRLVARAGMPAAAAERALKALLKYAGRVLGFRCTSIERTKP